MITLNGVKLAKNDTEFIDSLFDKGGTCAGYYKVTKRNIEILDHQKNKVGRLAMNKWNELILLKASKHDNGYWYSSCDIDIIGKYQDYMKYHEEIQKVYYEVYNITALKDHPCFKSN